MMSLPIWWTRFRCLALGAETPLADIIKLEERLATIQVTISCEASRKNFDNVNTFLTCGRHWEKTE